MSCFKKRTCFVSWRRCHFQSKYIKYTTKVTLWSLEAILVSMTFFEKIWVAQGYWPSYQRFIGNRRANYIEMLKIQDREFISHFIRLVTYFQKTLTRGSISIVKTSSQCCHCGNMSAATNPTTQEKKFVFTNGFRLMLFRDGVYFNGTRRVRIRLRH